MEQTKNYLTATTRKEQHCQCERAIKSDSARNDSCSGHVCTQEFNATFTRLRRVVSCKHTIIITRLIRTVHYVVQRQCNDQFGDFQK